MMTIIIIAPNGVMLIRSGEKKYILDKHKLTDDFGREAHDVMC